MTLRLLLDPRIFNFVIMSLYAVNCLNYAFRGNNMDALYWFGAFVITASVTFR